MLRGSKFICVMHVNAHLEYGRFVQALRRNDEALVHMHYADELDPSTSPSKKQKHG